MLAAELTEPVPVHRDKPPLRLAASPARNHPAGCGELAHGVVMSAHTVLPPDGLALVPH